ncbi:MAG: aminopeptidase [Lentisphaeria bacterium]|nr:aminopeptidase [Lentisphaeria bacterium]
MKATDCVKHHWYNDSQTQIDDLVTRICETYSDGNGVNHNEGCNLPREQEILRILQDLLEIIFPGFGDRLPQSAGNLKYMVGELLSRCRVALYDAIGRSFRYNCKIYSAGCDACGDHAGDAVNYLLESLPEIRLAVKQDVQAAFDGDPAAKTLDEIVLSYPGVKALTIHRIAHCLYEKKVPLIPRMMSEYAHRITGIDIHPGATIGRGVFIDHGTGVVIGETATLGSGVKIYQGVTLGALSFPKDACGKIIKGAKRHPTIEDDVTIYAGATILGAIVIGKGSVIGGNVWITESVEPGTKISIAPPQLTIFKPGKKAPSGWDALPENKKNDMLSSAERVLSKALCVKKSETTLLIYDKPTSNVGRAFILAAEQLGLSLTPRMIDVTANNGADPDPETIGMMLKHNVVIGATYHSLTHCDAMVNARNNGVRGCTLPGITDDMFTRAMKADPAQLRADGFRWRDILKGASRRIRIKTEKGTDLSFMIGNYPVDVDDANYNEPGIIGNIPAGETYLAPDPGTANGRIVVDASIGSLPWKEGDPDCSIELKNGVAVGFEGERAVQLRDLLTSVGEKAFVLAEFGIGTNPYLKLTGQLLEDEKVKGTVHLAFGNNCAMGGDNRVPIHIDCMVCAPDVFVDDVQFMEKGTWKV